MGHFEETRVTFEQPSFSLTELKSKIPKECFEKSLPRSLYYMIRDMLILSTAFFTYDYLSASWLGLLVYWNFYGFMMWCLFVVGHDCGHTSFSRYPLINAICGHLCHTPILVPFFPWAYSHSRHHQFHNHIDKDMSYRWLNEEELNGFTKFYIKSVVVPFITLGLYLYPGIDDGSHTLPTGRLYRDANKGEKIKCLISTLCIIAFIGILYMSFSSWSQFFLFYAGPWFVFSFWLFMVTYMQHHDEDTHVFDDSSWNFVSGALQTIDREYGFKIDHMHHNITDCHLAHHLFFTQIPHYHLKKATQALEPLLNGQHKKIRHKFFLYDFWKQFFKVNFTKWKLVTKKKNSDCA